MAETRCSDRFAHAVCEVMLLAVLLMACGRGGGEAILPTPIAPATTPVEITAQVPVTLTPSPIPFRPTPRATSSPVPPTLTATAAPVESTRVPSAADLPVPHIEMAVVVNTADRRLSVLQTVWVANHSGDTWNEIVFAVQPAHRPDAFLLESVQVTTAGAVDAPASYRLDGTMLYVSLPVPLKPEEAAGLTLGYTMNIPTVALDTWLPEGNLGAGERVLQAGDWHPTLVPYRDGQGWQVWAYHGVGDPTVYEVADYDVRISAGPVIIIAAPGAVTQEGGTPNPFSTTHRYTLSRARSFAFLASPDYHVIEARTFGVPLRVYYLPETVEGAYAVVETAERAIALFTELYGPYPNADLVIAQNAYYGAMEYSGLISMSGWALAAYSGSSESLLVILTAHEIAHQWWYGAVGNDQVREPWLDESLAKYSELLFYERYMPEAVQRWWANQVNRYHPNGPLDRTIYAFEDTSTYIQQIYGQGARFMADLRTLMGDEAFFTFLRSYRDHGDGRVVTAEDFFFVLRSHTTVDLEPLLARYFAVRPSVP